MRYLWLIPLLIVLARPAQAQNCCYDSGPVPVSVTISSGTHNAGSSLGGLITMPLARVTSGIMTAFQWMSPNGSTGQLVFRAWVKKPQSTCTDGSAYSNNSADDPYLIPGFPTAVTPAAPANTTGDSRTYAQSTSLTASYHNQDVPTTLNIYWCVVTVANDTTDLSSTALLTAAGPQD